MAVTYNTTTKIFTLGVDDLDFSIPGTWEGMETAQDSGILGNALGNLLTGDKFSNNIDGADGNDTIIGGPGGDILNGGAGIDTLSYANAAMGVNVTLNSADGLVNGFGTGEGDQKGDNINGFENLMGSAFGDTLNGNTANNLIEGGDGNDILVGKAGNDTLIGGVGADDMQGGTDNDLYFVDNAADYVRERAGEGYDTVITSVSFDLGARGDGEVEVLKAVAGTAKIDLSGSSSANLIIGNDANNVIDGKGGVDVMQGGKGNDIYYADVSNDQVVENAGEGTDIVYTKANYVLSANVENLTALSNAYNAISLTGNNLNNTIVGNEANNVINGGTGADTMQGGAGNDTYYVDDVNDMIIDTSGTNTVYTTATYNAGAQSIQKVVATGTLAINLTGNKLNNTLTGNAGANKLYGGLGNDVLTGGSGKDIFVFDTKANKKTNFDKITDFSVKDDTIWLDNKYMPKLGKGTELKPGKLNKGFFTIGDKAKDKNDYLIYDNKKGVLYYDADGSGAGKAVEIATLKKGLKMTYADFFVI